MYSLLQYSQDVETFKFFYFRCCVTVWYGNHYPLHSTNAEETSGCVSSTDWGTAGVYKVNTDISLKSKFP